MRRLATFVLLLPPTASLSYSEAWAVRIREGHSSAQPLFRRILLDQQDTNRDLTASTRIAASSSHLFDRFRGACFNTDVEKLSQLRELFKTAEFTTAGVAKIMQVDNWVAAAPLFAKSASAGSVTKNLSFKHFSTLEVLISFFILGLAVPLARIPVEAIRAVDLLYEIGLIDYCEVDPDVIVPLLAITPMNPDLYFVTDWHPRGLGLVRIDETQQPVMYIGPDSLALAEIWRPRTDGHLLDLCTGSGVQGIYQVALGRYKRATLVDVNPRAVRFARFNAVLNGVDTKVTVEQRDLCEIGLNVENWRHCTVCANPPFLPVPENDQRHGLYSTGGPCGSELLFRVIEIAQSIGARETAIVSEFFFNDDVSSYLQSLCQRWSGCGILFTNEYALDAEEYARRRADSSEEAEIWLNHLNSQNIKYCSPGLLFLSQFSKSNNQLKLVKVPRSELGSLWTPGNYVGWQFCEVMTNSYFSEDSCS